MSALVMLAALACGAADEVVARVGTATITSAAYARRAEGAGGGARPDAVLEQMVNETLLSSEGVRLGLQRSPAAVAHLEAAQRRAAASAFLDGEIAGKVRIDDATVQRVFHSTADFAAYDLLTFQTEEQAAAALRRIRGGSTFAAETQGAVIARVARDPADARLVMRGEMDEALGTALFAAASGSIVGPVKLREGFGVAQLLDKRVGTAEDLGARRAAIETYLRRQQADLARKHVAAQLRKAAGVTLDEAFLRSLDGEPSAAQLDHVIATVGGNPVRYRDVRDDIDAIGAAAGHAGPAMRIAVAWREVDARLVQDVAVKRGFLSAPEVAALRPEHEKAAVGYAAMTRIQDAAPAPTDKEVRSFYDRNAAAFRRPLAEVAAQARAGAAREKRQAAVRDALAALRKKTSISVDREALARAAAPRAERG